MTRDSGIEKILKNRMKTVDNVIHLRYNLIKEKERRGFKMKKNLFEIGAKFDEGWSSDNLLEKTKLEHEIKEPHAHTRAWRVVHPPVFWFHGS